MKDRLMLKTLCDNCPNRPTCPKIVPCNEDMLMKMLCLMIQFPGDEHCKKGLITSTIAESYGFSQEKAEQYYEKACKSLED